MALHTYALVSANGNIVRVTEPLETAPAPVDWHVWHQCPDDHAAIPAHCAHLFVLHSPEFVMQGHRVVRRFQIRRKDSA